MTTPRRPKPRLAERIDAFRERHPEIQITVPAGDGTWLVREPGQPDRMHVWGQTMMDDLEAGYPAG